MKKRIPSPAVSLIPIVVLVLLLYLFFGKYGADEIPGGSQLALLAATGVACGIGLVGYKVPWREVERAVGKNILNVSGALMMLLLIGALSGIWMVSGVIPTMIYYGLELINPHFFLFSTCLVSAMVSVIIGSSWTTIATIGLALMGIGQVLGISEGWVAGAIISGAYFGDKISPLSETTVLAASVTDTPLFTHIRYMKYTTVPSMLIALAVFAGVGYSGSYGDLSSLEHFTAVLEQTFVISPWFLLVPLFTLWLIVKKVPSLVILFLTVVISCVCALFFQPGILQQIAGGDAPSVAQTFKGLLIALYTETGLDTGDPVMNSLVGTRGIEGMLNTLCLILCAMSFGGAMYATGMIQSLTRLFLHFVKKGWSMVASTAFAGLFFNVVAADQYIAIILASDMFKDVYKRRRYESRLLSRTIEDSVTVTSVLIPWNTCGMAQSAVLGVATFSYLPYCVFNYISPLMSVVVMLIGYKIARLPQEDY